MISEKEDQLIFEKKHEIWKKKDERLSGKKR